MLELLCFLSFLIVTQVSCLATLGRLVTIQNCVQSVFHSSTPPSHSSVLREGLRPSPEPSPLGWCYAPLSTEGFLFAVSPFGSEGDSPPDPRRLGRAQQAELLTSYSLRSTDSQARLLRTAFGRCGSLRDYSEGSCVVCVSLASLEVSPFGRCSLQNNLLNRFAQSEVVLSLTGLGALPRMELRSMAGLRPGSFLQSSVFTCFRAKTLRISSN